MTAWRDHPPAHPWTATGRERVRFGVFGGPFQDVRRLGSFVAEAEALGSDSYWIPDHPTFNPDWVPVLAALAGSTERIRLGPLVSCIGFRFPLMLARVAADIDAISEGRFVLGVGIGHHEPEFRQMGASFPSMARRQQALRETLEVLRALWAGGTVSYHGEWVQLEAASLGGPARGPIPILVAGGGERLTLRLVAEFADTANLTHGTSEELGSVPDAVAVTRKLEVLSRHCRDVGRDPSSVLVTHATLRFLLRADEREVRLALERLPAWVRGQFDGLGLAGTPERAAEHFATLLSSGVRYFIVRIWDDDLETLRLFASDVVPRLDAMLVEMGPTMGSGVGSGSGTGVGSDVRSS